MGKRSKQNRIKTKNEKEKVKKDDSRKEHFFFIEFVVFSISAFLPGGYLLRVFPLICKTMKFHRLSLSLYELSSSWGSRRTKYWRESSNFCDPKLEVPIKFTESSWRAFQTGIGVNGGYSIVGLEAEHPWMLDGLSFPFVERFSIRSQSVASIPISIDNFPSLTNLEIGIGVTSRLYTKILDWVWKLPLVSLTLNLEVLRGQDDYFFESRPSLFLHAGAAPPPPLPTFAQTLRSLNTTTSQSLKNLLPYCGSLQNLTCPSYDEIMDASPGLTSLTLTRNAFRLSDDPIDLTRFGQLVELKMYAKCPFVSHGIHPQLHHVTLVHCDVFSASQFLSQCPVRHLSWNGSGWRDLAAVIAVLDPTQCKQLTLTLFESPYIAEVKKAILDRGFQITNPGFLLLDTSDGKERWREVMELAPEIRDWTLLEGRVGSLFSSLNCHPFLASFHGLIAIDIRTCEPWNQNMLSCVLQTCSVLEKFSMSGARFRGSLRLHSTSLRTISLQFDAKYSNFNLNLPQLTFLSLHGVTGEEVLLKRLLDGDPRIHLPLLQTLIIYLTRDKGDNPDPDPSCWARKVPCKAGHPTLTQLHVNSVYRALAISSITLRKLPCLRQVRLGWLKPAVGVNLNVPGGCKVELTVQNIMMRTTFSYNGGVVNSRYHKHLLYDTDQAEWMDTSVEKAKNDKICNELIEKTGEKEYIKRGKPKNRGNRGKGRNMQKKK